MKDAVGVVLGVLTAVAIGMTGFFVGQATAPEEVPEVCLEALSNGAVTITDMLDGILDGDARQIGRATHTAERFANLATECGDIG